MLKTILSILGAIAILCGALGPYLLALGVSFGAKLMLVGGLAALLGHSILDIGKARSSPILAPPPIFDREPPR